MSKQQKIFSNIFDQYIDKIYRFIFLKVNSQEISQDLTSEVFLRFWNRLNIPSSENSPIENPKAFLYQVARNLVIDHYREKGKVELISIESTDLQDPNMDLEKQAYLTSDIQQIQASLINLKQDYQDIVIWHYLDEFSIKEIAEMLNKSEGAIRVNLHRALKMLKEIMGEDKK